jgi:hypothetical protein
VSYRPATALQHDYQSTTVRLPRPAPRPEVTLVCAGQSAVLDLRRVRATRFRNFVVVRLDELWFASRLGGDLANLGFDFVGEEGIRSSASKGLLEGGMLRKGYLNIKSRDLLWDDPSVDQAFVVHHVTMIVAHDQALQGMPKP